jgi:hypothetical protein
MLNIKDVQISKRENSSVLLSEKQHLLRRFGAVHYDDLEEGETLSLPTDSEADEAWMLIRGIGILTLKDLREDSPSYDQSDELNMKESDSTSVLIPFGVNKYFQASAYCQIIRVVSHDI